MPSRVRLNYLQDTLLGPIAKSIECEATVTAITPGAFQVRVNSPVPDDLHKAHSLTIIHLPSPHLNGKVVNTRSLDNGDLELQIDV